MGDYKSYLLTFDTSQTDRDTLIEAIDNIDEIVNWSAFFPSALCIVTDLDARDVASKIRDMLPRQRFIVVQFGRWGERGGWLPKSTWNFIREPRHYKDSENDE